MPSGCRAARAESAERDRFSAGQAKRGRNSEQDSVDDRQRKSEAEDGRIRARGSQPGNVYGSQGRQDPPRRGSQNIAAETAQHSQQTAFGKKLANDPHLSRADREPHVDFALPGESARQQQVGDVGASDQHKQDSGGHQQQQTVGGDPYRPVAHKVHSQGAVAIGFGKIVSERRR